VRTRRVFDVGRGAGTAVTTQGIARVGDSVGSRRRGWARVRRMGVWWWWSWCQGAAGKLAGDKDLRRRRRKTRSKRKEEDVEGVRGITLKLEVDSEWAEGVHSGRNRGNRPPESEKGIAMWRCLGAPGLDSFIQGQEEVEAHPPVPAERRGVAGDDGPRTRTASDSHGMMGFLTRFVSACRRRKKGGRERRGQEGKERRCGPG
jgi:hypothetical protein